MGADWTDCCGRVCAGLDALSTGRWIVFGFCEALARGSSALGRAAGADGLFRAVRCAGCAGCAGRAVLRCAGCTGRFAAGLACGLACGLVCGLALCADAATCSALLDRAGGGALLLSALLGASEPLTGFASGRVPGLGAGAA